MIDAVPYKLVLSWCISTLMSRYRGLISCCFGIYWGRATLCKRSSTSRMLCQTMCGMENDWQLFVPECVHCRFGGWGGSLLPHHCSTFVFLSIWKSNYKTVKEWLFCCPTAFLLSILFLIDMATYKVRALANLDVGCLNIMGKFLAPCKFTIKAAL